MARQEKYKIFRNIDPGRTRKMQYNGGPISYIKVKPQYKETIKSLQFCKLVRQMNENPEEWMGRLWLAAVECTYKEIDRQLKEYFIHRLNGNEMLAEIIRELYKPEGNKIMTRASIRQGTLQLSIFGKNCL